MESQISEEDKERRWQEVMEVQADISRRKNEALIGTMHRVIIDGFDPETARFIGRTQAHAPEVDGVVYVDPSPARTKSGTACRPGDLVEVKITQGLDYDLIGEILDA